jgi:hypothetical protein
MCPAEDIMEAKLESQCGAEGTKCSTKFLKRGVNI